jgi:hypothetical protein
MPVRPLAAAQARIAKRGRPRKNNPDAAAGADNVKPAPRPPAPPVIPPRLLDRAETGRYLGNLSMQTVIEMDNAGVLKRVRITMAKGIELRKCLYDVLDLDRLIEHWKE